MQIFTTVTAPATTMIMVRQAVTTNSSSSTALGSIDPLAAAVQSTAYFRTCLIAVSLVLAFLTLGTVGYFVFPIIQRTRAKKQSNRQWVSESQANLAPTAGYTPSSNYAPTASYAPPSSFARASSFAPAGTSYAPASGYAPSSTTGCGTNISRATTPAADNGPYADAEAGGFELSPINTLEKLQAIHPAYRPGKIDRNGDHMI
ncbi:hypothetical protein LTR62_006450 [Meristemomyces frigidus]|uniref:Uncharacterized protein n=1 Tax=Meristemomyces frigidus TaxID=1508187 RepID=A0AAN7TCR4_9PEZI|nr:hypothetical protein LTR62_006450 [Meristemomyces frigidus]